MTTAYLVFSSICRISESIDRPSFLPGELLNKQPTPRELHPPPPTSPLLRIIPVASAFGRLRFQDDSCLVCELYLLTLLSGKMWRLPMHKGFQANMVILRETRLTLKVSLQVQLMI